MENLGWGLQMTVLGMGLVFALLALLWGLLMLVLVLDKEPKAPVSALETNAEAERIAAVADDAVGAQTPERPTVNGLPADLVAAILVATMKHKLTLRRQAAPFMRSYWPGSQLFASRWVATGRARQNNTWQPRGK
jgi:Na+-transporting methylmalonyl-CoA/oxaloacetate decarboxylase gamma subunit